MNSTTEKRSRLSSTKIDRLREALPKINPALFAALAVHRTHRGERLDFKGAPALKALYADEREKGCVMKSTQGGVSEWLLLKGVSEASSGRNVFWVLPTYNLVTRFVRERFDRTMALTPGYRALMKEVDGSRFSDSATLKQFGRGTIALVGSNTSSAFTEFPADTLIVDELDQCDQSNVTMAWERLSASARSSEWYVSNPTIKGHGIDLKYAQSTQAKWHIKCQSCGSWIHPELLKNVLKDIGGGNWLIIDPDYDPSSDRDIRAYCDKCGKPIDPKASGMWIEEYPSRKFAGYHLNKLFTANVERRELVDRFSRSEGDETLRQRVWNADFGLPYNAVGAHILAEDILACRGEYKSGTIADVGAVVMGVDVGRLFHVVVMQVRQHPFPLRIVKYSTVKDPEQVRDMIVEWNPRVFIIDALPESRVARELAGKAKNGYVCFFGGKKTETISKGTVTVDRTSLIDMVKAATVQKTVEYPVDLQAKDEFIEHMTASTRIFDEDANGGEGAYSWVEGSKQDHYLLAHAYGTLAARMLIVAGSR